MLIVLSPSKTLDYETPVKFKEHTQPELLGDAEKLIIALKKYDARKLSKLMDLSDKLSALNVQRYKDFTTPFTTQNARQALLAFKGDVYEPIEVATYTVKDFAFAQNHVRMLSGLYGLLRPLDLMQPYRLEMSTKLPVGKTKDLYGFWGARITEALNAALAEEGSGVLVNLASEEYFKAVRPDALKGRILHVQFKERRNNKLQTIGLLAKRARGLMTDWVVRERIADIKSLKKFDVEGYVFDPDLSGADAYVFVRRAANT